MSRSRHHTGWAGALALAAELSRREYDAAITLGNTPSLDLICASPSGIPFTIQVKSSSSRNWILIPKRQLEAEPRQDLYFAVVLIPADLTSPFQFFLLTHAQVCEYYSKQRRVKLDGTPYQPGHEGLAWGDVKQHEGRWDILPA